MADGIGVVVHWKKAVADLAAVDKAMDRATMWGLRESGRQVKRGAQKLAPVYRGPRASVPRGRLKKSIKSSRRLKKSGDSYSLSVGPRGYPAGAYGPKQEQRKPYMAPAAAAVSPAAKAIFAKAWGRAAKKL